MVKAQGKPLFPIWSNLTNSNDKIKIVKQLASILRTIHSIPITELQFLKKHPYPEALYWVSSIDLNLDNIIEINHRTKYLNEKVLKEGIAFIRANTRKLLQQKSYLLHTDINFENILVDEHTLEITAILDWEWAQIGDPLYDLTDIDSLLDNQKNLVKLFFDEYGLNISDNDFILRKKIYLIYQSLLTCTSGFHYHYPDKDKFSKIEKTLIELLKT